LRTGGSSPPLGISSTRKPDTCSGGSAATGEIETGTQLVFNDLDLLHAVDRPGRWGVPHDCHRHRAGRRRARPARPDHPGQRRVHVSGIPITLTRTYDTLDIGTQGEFGYGWQLDITSIGIEVKTDPGASPTPYGRAFRDGARVVVTLPDGTTEGFTFFGQQQTATYFATRDYRPPIRRG
jgi:hypothetical protein